MAPITEGKEAVLQCESVLPLLHTNVESNSKRTKAVSTHTHTHRGHMAIRLHPQTH